MLYLNLPQNEYELAGYVAAAAFSILVGIGLDKILIRWPQVYQRRFIWGITLMVFVFSTWVVWLAFNQHVDVNCQYDAAVERYLENRNKAIQQVAKGSDSWYKLNALESFRDEKMPCEVKGKALGRQQMLLDALIKQYNLQ